MYFFSLKKPQFFMPNSNFVVFVSKLNQTVMFAQLCISDCCHDDGSNMQPPSFPQNETVQRPELQSMYKASAFDSVG